MITDLFVEMGYSIATASLRASSDWVVIALELFQFHFIWFSSLHWMNKYDCDATIALNIWLWLCIPCTSRIDYRPIDQNERLYCDASSNHKRNHLCTIFKICLVVFSASNRWILMCITSIKHSDYWSLDQNEMLYCNSKYWFRWCWSIGYLYLSVLHRSRD